MRDRGQAYSLQGVIGAIIIVSALVLALQAVSISPFTGDGPNQGLDTKSQLQDTLDIVEDRNGLRTAVLCLTPDYSRPDSRLASTELGNGTRPVGDVLNSTASRTSNYNLYVVQNDSSGNIRETPIGNEQRVTGSGVSVTRTVVLFDDDPVYQVNTQTGNPRCKVDNTYQNLSVAESQENTYLDDKDKGDIFQIVQVRVVAW